MEHTATYEHYREKLVQLFRIRAKNGLDTNGILEYCQHLDKFQVVVPLIGEFSTGKSSLINALLDRKSLLGVELTPETAVPTEICYGEQEKAIVHGNSGEKEISLAEFSGQEFSVDKVHKVQLFINHEFLREISTVKIVDMPGFNSGVDLHNRAIDEYLPEAKAYILTFSARTPTIPEDMANFLRELKLHDVPVFLLITKAKAVTAEELTECADRIREDAKKYLNLSDVSIGVTNAKGKEKMLSDFADALRQIEGDSQRLFAQDAKNHLVQYGSDLATYLETSIKQANLTPSELEAEVSAAESKLQALQGKLAEAGENFDGQIEDCISAIRSRLTNALTDAAPSLENMLVRNIDIKDKVNMIVREAIISAMKEEFLPRVNRYMDKVADMISLDIAVDSTTNLDASQEKMDLLLKETTKSVIAKAMPAVLAAIGIAISGPVAAIILTVSGVLVELGFMKKRENEQRQLAQEKIQGEVIPQVTNRAMEAVRATIQREVSEINRKIAEEAKGQVTVQEKALVDIKEKFAAEQSEKQERIKAMQTDLENVRKLMQDVE